jgi:hypothetical protein
LSRLTSINSPESKGGLLVAALHAIYFNGRWYGGFPGEDAFYARHIEAAVELLHADAYEYLSLSGGRTHRSVAQQTAGLSEAEGARQYAIDKGLLSAGGDRIILEGWARDSMENLYFSILAFFQKTRRWPSRIGVVSWASKGLRFHLIACGMQLGGRIFFHGVGDYPTQTHLERACAAEVHLNAALADPDCVPPDYRLLDPLLRGFEFTRKRWSRMPDPFSPDEHGNKLYMEAVKLYAAGDPKVLQLIDDVERLKPGEGWRHIAWPWL